MTNKGKFEYSATTDGARVAAYLNKIADGLCAGSLSMAAANQTINLAPGGAVKLAIEADSNPDRCRGSIVLAISWKAATERPESPLDISTEPHEEAIALEPVAT